MPGYYCTSAGGHVQSGETYQQAAERELKEEIGLSIPIQKATELQFISDGHKRFIELFIVFAEDGFNFTDGEVASGEFINFDKAKNIIEKGEKIHPQLNICFNWLYDNKGQFLKNVRLDKKMKLKQAIIAARIIFNKNEDKILLIQRTDSMWGDYWSIPGGHVELGETIEEALERELKEELQLQILSKKFLGYEEFDSEKKNKHFISFNFIVTANENINPNEEIKEAKWFNLEEINNIKHQLPYEAIEYINKKLSK
mgnify:FL=1